jgi:hypothetical protein
MNLIACEYKIVTSLCGVGCRASMSKVIVGDQRAIATSSMAECLRSQALKSGPHDT